MQALKAVQRRSHNAQPLEVVQKVGFDALQTGLGSAEVVGLNAVGISRAGIQLEARRNIKKAYKLLYRSGLSLQQAIAVIEQEVDSCEEVEHFLRFLRNAERGICRERRERD